MSPDPVAEATDRLGLIASVLPGIRAGSSVGMAAAESLLGHPVASIEEARAELEAERSKLEDEAKAGNPHFIRKGDGGSRVRSMQERLLELGHDVKVDGSFGPKTLLVVKDFQQKVGLPQTGFVDAPTLEHMRQPPGQSYAEVNAAARSAMDAGPLEVGATGPPVVKLREMLGALGHDASVDGPGEYGRATQSAVRSLQRKNGLVPTGRADEQTQALLSRLHGEAKKAPRDGKDKAVKEAAVVGNPPTPNSPSSQTSAGAKQNQASGGPNPAVVATAAALLNLDRPPNLREAPAASFDACASCVHFGGSKTRGCELHGGYPVDRGDLCDDWKTLTPAPNRQPQDHESGEVEMDELGEAKAQEEGTRDLSEVKSSAYPGLDRSPKKNWVEKAGGLPSYIERIAKHIHYENGKPIGQAIAMAVGTVKRWCHGGEVAASAKGGVSKTGGVSAKTKALSCKAVAEWEAKKAASHAKSVAEATELLEAVGLTYDPAEMAAFQRGYELYEQDFKPLPPSLNYAAKTLGLVEAAHDDWDLWGEDGSAPVAEGESGELVVFADPAALALAEARPDPRLAPVHRVVGGRHVLFVAGVPVRVLESASEGEIVEASAVAFDAGLRRSNPKQVRARAAEKLRNLKGGMEKPLARRKHGKADAEVATIVSSRFAGKIAHPTTLAFDMSSSSRKMKEGAASPDSSAVEADALSEGFGGLHWNSLKHPRLAKGRKGGGRFAHVLDSIDKHAHEEPLTKRPAGEPVEDWVARMEGAGGGAKKPAVADVANDPLAVDAAIGGVLQSFPGLDDWSVEAAGGGWRLRVKLGGETHHFSVSHLGEVSLVDEHGAPMSAPPPKPSAHHGTYTLTGDTEKPYHMAEGQVYQGKDGKWYRKIKNVKKEAKTGAMMAAVEIEDIASGTKKVAPAFAVSSYYDLAEGSLREAAEQLEEPAVPATRTRVGRLLESLSELAEASDAGDDAALRARISVLEGRLTDEERSDYARRRPDRAYAVAPRGVAMVRAKATA